MSSSSHFIFVKFDIVKVEWTSMGQFSHIAYCRRARDHNWMQTWVVVCGVWRARRLDGHRPDFNWHTGMGVDEFHLHGFYDIDIPGGGSRKCEYASTARCGTWDNIYCMGRGGEGRGIVAGKGKGLYYTSPWLEGLEAELLNRISPTSDSRRVVVAPRPLATR